MRVSKPVFIVGCGRSGTTLLFNMLSAHPCLMRTTGYPDGEDHAGWIRHGGCAMAGIGNVNSSEYGSGINGFSYCLHMTEADATETVVAAMRSYYWREVLREDGARRVLNKQPHLSNKLRYLLAIFPDAKIIHIVRDCEPVVASWLAVMGDHPSLVAYWPEEQYPCFWLFPKPSDDSVKSALARNSRVFPGGGSAIWVDYWVKINRGIEEQMMERLDQLCVVRYEDLIKSPASVLRAICRFCELPEYDQHGESIELGTVGKHANLLTPELRAMIEERTRPLRDYFGYSSSRSLVRKCNHLLRG